MSKRATDAQHWYRGWGSKDLRQGSQRKWVLLSQLGKLQLLCSGGSAKGNFEIWPTWIAIAALYQIHTHTHILVSHKGVGSRAIGVMLCCFPRYNQKAVLEAEQPGLELSLGCRQQLNLQEYKASPYLFLSIWRAALTLVHTHGLIVMLTSGSCARDSPSVTICLWCWFCFLFGLIHMGPSAIRGVRNKCDWGELS